MYLFCKRWIKLLLFLPCLVFFCVWTLYPVLTSFQTAFQFSWLLDPHHYYTLDNWVKLATDWRLPIALKNTGIIVACSFILLFPLGVGLGLFLNIKFRGSGVVKLVTFTPVILSGVMTALIWFFIVDPGLGFLNPFLRSIGLGGLARQWIGGKVLTPYTLSVIGAITGVGWYGVVVMSGLKMIPSEVNEAATIDGVTRWQRTRHITLPMLKETLKIVVVYIVIGSLGTFQSVFVLTRGGPDSRSHVLASYIYGMQWGERNMGYGAVLSMILFVLIMGFSIGFLTLTRRRIED